MYIKLKKAAYISKYGYKRVDEYPIDLKVLVNEKGKDVDKDYTIYDELTLKYLISIADSAL